MKVLVRVIGVVRVVPLVWRNARVEAGRAGRCGGRVKVRWAARAVRGKRRVRR